MSSTERSIDVHAPVSAVYDQWTQFESFPQFMEGVDEIRQLTDTKTHWKTSIAGVHREFDAEITEQHPEERVAWKSTDGEHHAGVVTFHRIDDETTRVHVQMDFAPEGVVEKAGDVLGVVSRRVQGDLERFKTFIESRGGAPTGVWRGEVEREPQKGEAGGSDAGTLPSAGDPTDAAQGVPSPLTTTDPTRPSGPGSTV